MLIIGCVENLVYIETKSGKQINICLPQFLIHIKLESTQPILIIVCLTSFLMHIKLVLYV